MEEILTINQVKEQYKDKWVVLEVIEEDEAGETTKGKVIFVSDDRDKSTEILKNFQEKYLELLYTGKIPEDITVILFSKVSQK